MDKKKLTIKKPWSSFNIMACVSILFLFSICFQALGENLVQRESPDTPTITPTETPLQELDLLRVEHFLYVNASEDVGIFHIRYSFPPDYEYQVPLMFELYNDSTTTALLHYQIENDTEAPNKIVNFTIGPLDKGESILLHFSCWVLVENHDFSDLPTYVEIPKRYQLPKETRIWLDATKEVQLHSILIKHTAKNLHGLSDNLIRYAGRVASFIKQHRYALFVIELHLGLFLSQDARTTLLINGENVGRSHLACAFFRMYNIPARVLLANNDQGFWTQMHYMVEYYCPGYGWVLLDSTRGETPYATKHQIINRVCYPKDEDDTKRDYILPFMTGEERWLWIDTPAVTPYYSNLIDGSKSQMFTEANLSTDPLTAQYAFVLSQVIFREYQRYLGVNLTGENLLHFQNALGYQQDALFTLQGHDIQGYISSMNQASAEYSEIFQ